MIFYELLQNAALLIILAFLYSQIIYRLDHNRWPVKLLVGLLFGLCSVASMYTTFQWSEGIVFDGRSIILSIAGYVGGIVPGLIALIMALVYRVLIGGEGLLMGILVIISSTFIGIIFNWTEHRFRVNNKFIYLFLLGLIVHALLLLFMVTLPVNEIYQVFDELVIPVLVIFPMTTAVIGWFFHDQGQKISALETLGRNEERFRTYIESAPIAIFSIRLSDNKIRSANQQFYNLLGISPSVTYLTDLFQFIHLNISKHDLYDCLHDPDRCEKELMITTGSSEIIHCMLKVSKVNQDSVICFLSDITDIRISEREKAKKDELLRLAFEGTMDGIWVWDIDKKITFDERWTRLLGYEEEEIHYTPEWFLSKVHPDDLGRLEAALESYLKGSKDKYEVEYRIKTKSGNWRWIWGVGKASKWDKEGNPIQISGTHRDITDRKELERQKRENEERYVLAQEAAMIGTWEYDILSNKMFWSETLNRIFGDSDWKFPGTIKAFLDYIHPGDRDRVAKNIEKSITNGTPYEEEYRIQSKSNGEKWLYAKGKISDTDGKSGRMIGIVQDITSAKQAELNLRESEKTFRALFDNSMDGIVYSSPKGEYRYGNQAFLDIIGYTHEEMKGKTWRDITPEKWHSVQEKIYREKLFKIGQSGLFEKEYVHKSDHTVPIHIASSIHYDENRDQEGIWSIVRDISQLKKASETIKESEAKLRTIVDSAPVGISIHDKEGRLTFVNKYLTDLVGLPENTKDKDKWMESIHPDDRERILKKQDEALKNRDSYQETGRMVDKNGKELWCQISSTPIVVDQEYAGIVFLIMDITHQVRREEELKEHKQKLEKGIIERTREIEGKTKNLEETQKALTFLLEDVEEARKELEESNRLTKSANQELEAFSYSVSHDLRAPLRSIDGFSNALLEDYGEQLDDIGKDFLNRIHKASVRMGQLIEDLLRLSRISRMEINLENVNITRLSKDIIHGLKEQDPDRIVNVIIDDEITIDTDRQLLKIMMENLIGNAWKFTREREEGFIKIGKEKGTDEAKIILFIQDNGTGFDMKHEAEMYNPFQRLHNAGEFEGSGIGLATVKRIINRLGGHISAESVIGEGSTFYLEFKN